nr:hypothetical protein CFP56_27902 [Quercus suber]
MKKGSISRFAKPKLAKKGDDSSEFCFDIVSFKGGLSPMGNIVLKGSPPSSARTHSSRCPTTSKTRPAAPQPSVDALPSNRTRGNKRKMSPPLSSATTERKVCYL